MAAICMPYVSGQPGRRVAPPARRPVRHPASAGSRAAGRPRNARLESRGLRRYLPGAATLVTVAGVWLGASMLASSGSVGAEHPGVSAGSALYAGENYVVKPGDTLQSIAVRLEPGADSRPVVALLSLQLHGAPLKAGDHLTLP